MLIVPPTSSVVPVKVDAVIEFTFAIVSYRGNPKVLIIFHVEVSRDVKERVAKGWEI